MNKIYFALLLISSASLVFAFPKKTLYIKITITLLLLWLFTSIIAIAMVRGLGYKNNLIVFHVSTLIEYVLLSIVYNEVIENKKLKRLIVFSVPVFIVTGILFTIFVQSPVTNNSYMIMIESVIMIFLSLFFLRETILLQKETVLHRFPMFWISVAILFYFTGSLAIEGTLNYLIEHSMELAKRAYRIGYIFKYLFFMLLITGTFCKGK